jgi:hypothetical protein
VLLLDAPTSSLELLAQSVLAEYKVNRCSRRCCVEDRPLREGEWYYSVVIEDGEELIRREYSANAWTEPPDGTVGWWKCRMPQSGQRKMVLAPDPVLVETLRQMEHDDQRKPLAFLLALTLLRRRIVKMVPADSPANPALPKTMRLQVATDGSEIEIEEYTITRRQTETLTEALQELLYVEAAE